MTTTQAAPVTPFVLDDPAPDRERRDEVQRRHTLLAEYLELKGFDALLLQRTSNIAWLSCGGDVSRAGSCQPTAAVFLTPDARVVLTTNVDSPLLFDGPLNGLGFQLKERPWQEPRDRLWKDLCRGRKVASDVSGCDATVVDSDLAQFRARLTRFEEVQLRELGRDLAHALEAACRTCEPGASESEIAGQVMHRLAHHQIAPVRVQVVSDGRGERYRHWGFSDSPIRQYAILSAVGRRSGLHLAATRTFSFGAPPPELFEAHHRAALIFGTGYYFSQAGWSVADVWARVRRIYEKFNAPQEWRLADQGEVVGYEACEQSLVPGLPVKLASGQAVHWHPSVGPAAVGDSILIQEQGQTFLTPPSHWPMLTVSVKGTPIDLPGILQREPGDDWVVG